MAEQQANSGSFANNRQRAVEPVAKAGRPAVATLSMTRSVQQKRVVKAER